MSIQALRILVVDDNRDSVQSMVTVLTLWGHDVRGAYDGSEALSVAQDFAPQVALLDIGLPVMDGFVVGQHLRQLPGLADIKLIAVTGYGDAATQRRATAVGFFAHLLKPADLGVLRRLLDDHLATRPNA